ncbi:MAG: hypothetical protein JW913_04245 [Chitinispirillaceae bacterium]|nr:hypothetical protein [Chitinispirillaceae bacterium]
MKNSRLVIETTTKKKKALDYALKDRGTTLTEWFNDKVAEIAVEYEVQDSTAATELETLSELESSSEILRRLKAIDWDFTDSDTTFLTHGIHPYPARFIPQIPNTLIRMLSLRGETVWDPFGGCGTTALEAIRLGRNALSTDLNPIAALIGKAKCTTISADDYDEIERLADRIRLIVSSQEGLDELHANSAQYEDYIPRIPNIEKWFHHNAVAELSYLLHAFSGIKSEEFKNVVRAALSNIIVKVSFQDSETRYVSKSRQVEKGATLRLFAAQLLATAMKIRNLSSSLRFRHASFETVDLRKTDSIGTGTYDLVVTSPPYPNATDYHLYHRFRLFWLGFDPAKMASAEIGSHLRHQKQNTGMDEYLDEIESSLRIIHKGIRPGRIAVLVLGDGVFHGKTFDTADAVRNRAEGVGFEAIGIVPRKVHSTKRSFINAARRLREEKLLILRKPRETVRFTLLNPPYRLWPYEDVLRKKELGRMVQDAEIRQNNGTTSLVADTLDIENLRRLTFTHGYWASEYTRESTWQAVLENGDAFKNNGRKKDPKYVTHGIHEYKGKFYPQLAKALFNIGEAKLGGTVLDPFCGSGTVLLEAVLNGMHGYGLDLNPLAVKIARAKAGILSLDPTLVDKELSRMIGECQKLKPSKDHMVVFLEEIVSELHSWFPEPVLAKMAPILEYIRQLGEPLLQDFFEVCLSSIVRQCSQQEPRDLRIRRRKTPIDDAPVFDLYVRKLVEQRERLRRFAKSQSRCPFSLGQAIPMLGDSRHDVDLRRVGLEGEEVDLVVTSPPYATALPYIDTDRLSMLLLFGMKSVERAGIEKSLVGSREIGKRERFELEKMFEAQGERGLVSKEAQNTIDRVLKLNRKGNAGFRKQNMAALLYRYFTDMTKVMKNLDAVVKRGGSLFFVIGDNKTTAGKELVSIRSGQVLQETGRWLGWKVEEVISITVTQENRLHNKNGITENEIIWFQKP